MSTIQIGIDLGTTNTLVYGENNGKIKPIKINGSVTFPSVLYVEEDGTEVVGKRAKQKEYLDPDNGIHSSKTYIGTKKEWKIRGKSYTPTDVAARILSSVYAEVKKKYSLEDSDVIQAVITIPAYFTANQSDETKKAGERAGFEVLRIITEPVAAAYNINPSDNGLICVIDLGGGTFDISVVDKQKEKYTVLGIDGDPRLGGDDFDKALEEYLIDEIEDELGIDLSTLEKSGLSYEQYYSMKAKIRVEAIACKEELSDSDECNIIINDLMPYGDGKMYHYDTEITREEFDRACSGIYKKILDVIKRLIENSNKFSKKDIKHVYLVGGSCYIPKIRQIVENYFGVAANSEGGLEEQVAQGAAKIADGYNTPAYSKDGTDPFDDLIKDITSYSMGVKIAGDKFSEIIPVGNRYPCTICDKFTTQFDNQEAVTIEVYEKINKDASDIINGYEKNYDLYGSFILEGIEKAKAGLPQINVTFNYDLSRTLHVTAEDMKTGAKKTVKLKKGEVVKSSSVKATDFYIVLDVSGSMIGERLTQAKIACTKLVNETLDLNTHRLGIITFGNKAELISGLSNDRNALLSAIDVIRISGSTNMSAGMDMANKSLMDSTNDKAIILITDGNPNSTGAVLNRKEEASKLGISIATIGVQDADRDFLSRVASNHDLNFMVNDVEKLADTFGQAVQNLLSK